MSIPEQNAPLATEMSNWPSYTYWRESDDRVKQFWYVSFCLMMSSTQDRLTGLALRENGNLNWATTAFYYSAVHAGRLLCFICCGDYPTGHAELANLLAPIEAPRMQRQPRRFRFDWLDKFQRYVRPDNRSRGAQPPQQDHDVLVAAINATLPMLRAPFNRFAPLLSKFKNLRNDCNYEALLVAHEVNHLTVTEGFKNLVESAEQASRLAVELAIDAYLTNLQGADCFNRNREQFHAAHSKYLHDRFEHSLSRKFHNSITAKEELRRFTGRLDWPGAPSACDLDGFLAPIMYDTFGEKQGLMGRWLDDIAALRRQLGSDV
jgi:hypothetical protein